MKVGFKVQNPQEEPSPLDKGYRDYRSGLNTSRQMWKDSRQERRRRGSREDDGYVGYGRSDGVSKCEC